MANTTEMMKMANKHLEFVTKFLVAWFERLFRLVGENRIKLERVQERYAKKVAQLDLMVLETEIEKSGAKIVSYGEGRRFRENIGRQCVFLMDGQLWVMYLSEIDFEYNESESMIGKFENGNINMLDELYCKRGYIHNDLPIDDKTLLCEVLSFIKKNQKKSE